MRPGDLADVKQLADRIHRDHPEDLDVLRERQRLFPDGCFLLSDHGAVAGYALSHPWRFSDPPALNARLGELPRAPDTYYIHDLALRPESRGNGHAGEAVRLLAGRARAAKLPRLSLIAVSGSDPFWRKQGFARIDDPDIARKLSSYGAGALLLARDLAS